MTYGYITTWLKHKSCDFFLRKLSDDFQPQGKKWLKIQPQKLPVAKFVVAGHRWRKLLELVQLGENLAVRFI